MSTNPDVTQLDLTNRPADTDLVPQFCPYCGVRLAEPHDAGYPDEFAVFRAHRRTHMPWGPDVDEDDDPTRGDNHYTGPDGEPMELGAWYEVTLSFSVDYRLRVAGRTNHDAKRRAKELSYDVPAADKYLVHSELTERGTITEADPADEIPDHLEL